MGTHVRLISDAGEYASWLWRATRRLAEVDRGAALRLIASTSVNQVVTFLVFFLPLKVVLLVASDGVSRYFQFFITQDTKSTWIAIIVVAILVFYVISIRLDTVADRSASRGAESLIRTADQVPVTSDPEGFAKTTIYRIGESIGGLIFGLLTLAAGAVVFPAFFLAIPVLLLVELLVVAVSLSEGCPPLLKGLGEFIDEKPQELIKWLRQINFLVIFSVLIVLFLIVEGINPLLGIAAILLSRRLFGALKDVARDSLKLSGDRRLVDALLFSDARVRNDPARDRDRLLGRALPAARLENIRKYARRAGDEVEHYTDDSETFELLESVEEAVWVDSGQSRMAMFDLYRRGSEQSRIRLFREYLYTGKGSRGLEQHDFLLRFLPEQKLRCPSRVVAYRSEGLVGRVVDFRGLTETCPQEWGSRRDELLGHLWGLEVPGTLIEAYNGAHRRFHERVAEELLGLLAVAADEPWARSTYDLLAERLESLCDRIAAMPLMLFNERLTRRNALVGPDERSLLLDWTSWSLQPIGSGFLPDADGRALLEVADRKLAARTSGGLGESDVLVASLLQRTYRLAHDGYPKTALSVVSGLLPLIDEPDSFLVEEIFPRSDGALQTHESADSVAEA